MKKGGMSIEAARLRAQEKARIFGKKVLGLSPLEQAGQEWQWQRELAERREAEGQAVGEEEAAALHQVAIPAKPVEVPSDASIGWFQFNPWKKEEPKRKPRLNMATIRMMGKRIMATEWARAIGKKRPDPRVNALEREARLFQEKREEAERRAAEQRQRAQRQMKRIARALQAFGRKLVEERVTTSDRALELLEESLKSVGQVFEVNLNGEGCEAYLEPWEERRARNHRETRPVIYHLKIGDRLEVTSYEPASEKVREALQGAMEAKRVRDFLSKERPGLREFDSKAVEQAIGKTGRVIEVEQYDGGWRALIEPWGEMRRRNIERKGQPPIVTYELRLNKNLEHLSYEIVNFDEASPRKAGPGATAAEGGEQTGAVAMEGIEQWSKVLR